MEDLIQEQDRTDEKYMREAIRQAKKAYALNETPIGCVIVHEGKIIGRGYNRRKYGQKSSFPRGDFRNKKSEQKNRRLEA